MSKEVFDFYSDQIRSYLKLKENFLIYWKTCSLVEKHNFIVDILNLGEEKKLQEVIKLLPVCGNIPELRIGNTDYFERKEFLSLVDLVTRPYDWDEIPLSLISEIIQEVGSFDIQVEKLRTYNYRSEIESKLEELFSSKDLKDEHIQETISMYISLLLENYGSMVYDW